MQELEKLPQLPEKPYTYAGLTVQGVSPTRLTPYGDPHRPINVSNEVAKAVGLRAVAKLFIENRTAIVRVGLGLPPAAPTVRAHVRALIISAELGRMVANMHAREEALAQTTPTPKPAHRSDIRQELGDELSDKLLSQTNPDVEL